MQQQSSSDEPRATSSFSWKKRRRRQVQVSAAVLFTLSSLLLLFVSEVSCVDDDSASSAADGSVRPWSGRDLFQPDELLDEENDEKLFNDVLTSIQLWQQHKIEKAKHAQRTLHRHKRDEEVVCYGDLGCFRDEGPFDYLDMLPSPPEEVATKVFLYTRDNREISQVLVYNNMTSVRDSNYNASLPLKIIIHGFGSGCNRVWTREMRLSFLAVEACNVICVDWGPGAIDPNYVRAAVNTRLVGKQIAVFLKLMQEEVDSDVLDETHMIGFSLGAHVAGFAGAELKNISRITGLDPAGPLFEGYDVKVRLDKSDAKFVDVIHSNGESLIVGGLGVWEPIGHVDFYPNGGRAQNGCQHLIIGGLYDFIYSYSSNNATYRYLCNHRRAYKLFTNSISPKCQFRAFPCESYETFETGACFSCSSNLGECGQLGYYSNQAPGRGSLYLLTRDEEPFCGNQYRINVMFTSTRFPIHTYGRLQILLIDKDGLNETHALTQDVDDLLTSGSQLEKLIVVHPAIYPVEVQVLYIAYDGWIYSGRYQWSIDKLVLTDSDGKKRSFCQQPGGQLLPSGLAVHLKLTEGDCVAGSLRYPIAPYRKYPKRPLPAPVPPKKKKFPPEHKLKSGSGQDVYYVTNSASGSPSGPGSSPETENNSVPVTLVTIHDEVAPISVPEKPITTFHSHVEQGEASSLQDLSPHYHIDELVPPPPPPPLAPLRPLQNRYKFPPAPVKKSKPGLRKKPAAFSGQQPSWAQTVSSGPLYSKPDSAAPESAAAAAVGGNDVDNGTQFPTRSRPSSSNAASPEEYSDTESDDDLVDLSASESDAESTEEESSTEISTQTSQPPPSNSSSAESVGSSTVKMHLLADDQLTILKIGPDNKMKNTSLGDDKQPEQEVPGPDPKVDYIILHKLPNGEALDLENLQTYSMADIKEGKMPPSNKNKNNNNNNNNNHDIFETPRGDAPHPRPPEVVADFDTFSVNEGNDGLRPDAFHSQRVHPPIEEFDEPLLAPRNPPPPQLAVPERLVISTRPPPVQEIYEPKPLDELDDLEAMPFHDDKPVYIIHKADYSNHPYFVSFKDPPPRATTPRAPLSNVPLAALTHPHLNTELLKLPRASEGPAEASSARKMPDKGAEKPPPAGPSGIPTAAAAVADAPSTQGPVKDSSEWIPISTQKPKPTYGPPTRPPGFISKTVSFQQINKLSNIATLKLTNVGSLAEEYNRRKKDLPPPPPPLPLPLQQPSAAGSAATSMQLLPDKLSSFLTHAEGKDRSLSGGGGGGAGFRPGHFRENKIAPIFKADAAAAAAAGGLRGHRSRAFGSSSGGRHSRRLPPPPPPAHFRPPYQTQMVPFASATNRYIPLHARRRKPLPLPLPPPPPPPPSKLWWLPIPPMSSLSDELKAPKALIRDKFFVENASFEEESAATDSTGSGSKNNPKIIAISNVEISSPRAPEQEPKELTEAGVAEEGEEEPVGSRPVLHMEEPLLPPISEEPTTFRTSTEARVVRLQQPFVSSQIVEKVVKEAHKEEHDEKKISA